MCRANPETASGSRSAIVPASSDTSYKRNTQLADISISCAWTTLSRMTPELISNHQEALCGSLTNSRATIEPCPYHLPLGVANVQPLTSAGGDGQISDIVGVHAAVTGAALPLH